MEPGRTGGDDYPIESVFTNILLNLGLSRFRTGIALIQYLNNPRQLAGILGHGGTIDNITDVRSAMANINTNANGIR